MERPYEKPRDCRYTDLTIKAQAERIEKLESALREIEERFSKKLKYHKEDCFAYQVAVKALSSDS